MKKIDIGLITGVVIVLVLTYLFKFQLSVPVLVMLTTILPMLVFPVIGGRLVYTISSKFSLFNLTVASSTLTLIVFGYGLMFPWSKLINAAESNMQMASGASNLISTLITMFILTTLVFYVVKKKGDTK